MHNLSLEQSKLVIIFFSFTPPWMQNFYSWGKLNTRVTIFRFGKRLFTSDGHIRCPDNFVGLISSKVDPRGFLSRFCTTGYDEVSGNFCVILEPEL